MMFTCFLCSFMQASSFVAICWGEMALFISVQLGVGEVSHGLGVQDVAGCDSD